MYWVYITEDSEAGITIGFSAEMDKTFLKLSASGKHLFYLRSFRCFGAQTSARGPLVKNNQEVHTEPSGGDEAMLRQTFI